MSDGYSFYTLSGRMIDLRRIHAADIDLDDIIQGLKSQVRFNGHTFTPYTVAHHEYALWTFADSCRMPEAVRIELLLHDMPEYMTGDIVTGIKKFLQPSYGHVETAIDLAIRARFGLETATIETQQTVKRLDYAAYVAEAHALQGRQVEGALLDPKLVAITQRVAPMSPDLVGDLLREVCRKEILKEDVQV